MAQPGGPKRGQIPNQYAHKLRCQCDGPIPDGEGDCLKCGHILDFAQSLRADRDAGLNLLKPDATPARGRTLRTSGTGGRRRG